MAHHTIKWNNTNFLIFARDCDLARNFYGKACSEPRSEACEARDNVGKGAPAARADPNASQALLASGKAALDKADLEKAEKDLSAAVSKDPDSEPANLYLAATYMKKKDCKNAEKYLEKAQEVVNLAKNKAWEEALGSPEKLRLALLWDEIDLFVRACWA